MSRPFRSTERGAAADSPFLRSGDIIVPDQIIDRTKVSSGKRCSRSAPSKA